MRSIARNTQYNPGSIPEQFGGYGEGPIKREVAIWQREYKTRYLQAIESTNNV